MKRAISIAVLCILTLCLLAGCKAGRSVAGYEYGVAGYEYGLRGVTSFEYGPVGSGSMRGPAGNAG